MKICKTLTKFSLLLCVLALGSGCLPASLTKWQEEPAAKPKSGSSVTGPDGSTIDVPAPTAGVSGPTSFNYGADFSAGAEQLGFKTKVTTTFTPTFIGAPSSITNSYVFSSYDPGDSTVVKTIQGGLTLNATTGIISGTPTSYASEQSYIIKAYHVNSGTTTEATITINIGTDLETLTFYYRQQIDDKLVLTLPDVSSFSDGDSISNSQGIVGLVNYVDTSAKQLHVVMTNLNGGDLGFQDGEGLDDAATFVTAETTITAVTRAIPVGDQVTYSPLFKLSEGTGDGLSDGNSGDEALGLTYGISPEATGLDGGIEFNDDASDDNEGQFVIPENSASLPTTTYSVTVHNSINQTKTITVRFSISKAPEQLSYSNKVLLTVDDNSFFSVGDTITSGGSGSGIGRVERKFSSDHLLVAVSSGEFLAEANVDSIIPYTTSRALISAADMVNAVFSVTGDASTFPAGTEFATVGPNPSNVGVVVYNDTSLIVDIAMNASDEDLWSPGDMIVGRQNSTGDDTGIGTVLRNNGTSLEVSYISGEFNFGSYAAAGTGDCVQNRGVYWDDSTDDPCSGEEDSTGALATSGAIQTLYVRITKGSFSTTDTIYPSSDGVSADSVDIDAIAGDNVILTLDSGDNFKSGFDMTTEYGTTGVVGSVGTGADSDKVYVMVENSYFKDAEDVSKTNPFAATDGTISSYSSYEKFNLYRGELATIKPALSQGDNVTYRIGTGGASTLPAGLSLDAATGIISGTPTQPFASTSFQLEARSAVCSTTGDDDGNNQCPTYSFHLEVFDQFKLENLTADAYSYRLHKMGRGRQSATCRITNAQLNTIGYQDSKDIVCFLEAGELDIYSSGLKLKSKVGGGMCNFVSIIPYSFYQYEYKVSSSHAPKIFNAYSYSCAAETAPANDEIICDSDYSQNDPAGPNCDTGTYQIVTVTGTDPGCAKTYGTGTATSCGGKRSACVNGPVKDAEMLTDAQIELGSIGVSYASGSGSGFEREWTFDAPWTKGHYSNQYLANFEQANSCVNNTFSYYTNSWKTYASGSYYEVKVENSAAFAPREEFTNNASTFTGIVSAVPDSTTVIVQGTGAGSTGAGGLALLNAATSFDDANPYGAAAALRAGSCSGEDNPTQTTKATCEADNGTWTYVTRTATYAYDNPFRKGQPYYEINCLNANSDTIGRIRLVVRDWNRAFNSTTRIDRIQPDLNPSAHPSFMDVNSSDDDFLDPFGNNYNNIGDWDDDSASFEPGICNATTQPVTDTASPTALHTFPGSGL